MVSILVSYNNSGLISRFSLDTFLINTFIYNVHTLRQFLPTRYLIRQHNLLPIIWNRLQVRQPRDA